MLQPLLHLLNSQKIILASTSPRRREILENIGLKFDVVPSKWEENLNKSDFQMPYEYTLATATRKGYEIASILGDDLNAPDVIISADTVVSCDGVMYEKPKDEMDAFRMLSELSGRAHIVFTGVALLTRRQTKDEMPLTKLNHYEVHTFYEATEVVFARLTTEVIQSYIATREPMDKAGAYGIQGIGGSLVECIRGDYYNVMGFPLHRFCKEMLQIYGYSHCLGT